MMKQAAKRMFHSATIKLTAWYLLIIMSISVAFSVGIYHLSVGTVQTQLDRYEQNIVDIYLLDINELYLPQLDAAQTQMIMSLFWVNVFILLTGGLGSYFLARRTLMPIERMHEVQSRFVSDASHELRTPLASMSLELEVALRDPNISKEEMRELLESSLEEVQKLTGLSQTLLKLSTGNTKDIEFDDFNLSEAVQSAAKKNKRIHAKVSDNTYVHANMASIEELLTLLTDNALKYSPEDSEIKIKLSKRSARIVLKVINEGDGIAPDDLPHIFDRFYRADNSRNSDGHGLGLALAKQIVDLHSGTITASSTQNKTTTFTVTLPTRSHP